MARWVSAREEACAFLSPSFDTPVELTTNVPAEEPAEEEGP